MHIWKFKWVKKNKTLEQTLKKIAYLAGPRNEYIRLIAELGHENHCLQKEESRKSLKNSIWDNEGIHKLKTEAAKGDEKFIDLAKCVYEMKSDH